MNRLPSLPINRINRSKAIRFTFDGKSIQAFEGDTIGSALLANDHNILSRSFKYHRPRGLFCMTGSCPNCLVEVDQVPNVRACVTLCREGMVVKSQNVWPWVNFDFLRFIDFVSFLLPVGFYYKTFIYPKSMWPFTEKFIRHISGLGRITPSNLSKRNDSEAPKQVLNHNETFLSNDVLHIHSPIAIVGGGPAGMAAALRCSQQGQKVVLIEKEPELGGHLRFSTDSLLDPQNKNSIWGYELAQSLSRQIAQCSNIQYFCGAEAFGLYESNLLTIVQSKRLIKIRAKEIIIATGRSQHHLVFENNDLPGIFLGDAVKRLISLYGVAPGHHAVIVTNSEERQRIAKDIDKAGINVVATALYPNQTILKATGFSHVKGAVLTDLDTAGNPIPGSENEVSCDLIILAMGWDSVAALLGQNGCKWQNLPNVAGLWPKDLPQGIHMAGHVTGLQDFSEVYQHGALIADQVTGLTPKEKNINSPLRTNSYNQTSTPTSIRRIPGKGKKKFICLCEDIIEKDIKDAIIEGFNSPELLKRYTTVSMGPCQGKVCSITSNTLCSRVTNQPSLSTALTTLRPPTSPVSLGVLAAGRHHLTKYTPMHHQHLSLSAVMMDLGEWKRPHHYIDIAEECKAVHENAGIIDVSTLGKIAVVGRDAGALLDFVYTHRFSDLKIGRVRYGLMCDDSGTILDDGTISRIDEEEYFITTTSGNIAFVEQWLKWWASTNFKCVHITNVTGAYAAVNIAGPKSRDILKQLTTIDLSYAAFPYLATKEASVAGIQCRLMRIGFVGEMGWEIHFPAEAGELLWSALMEVGKPMGLTPFGVEAQRVLRLEKAHIIIGVDTDGLTSPFEADMKWAIKFDKQDFVGKTALMNISERALRHKLVGFAISDNKIPSDGSAIVKDKFPVGRVTSCRYSSLLQKTIGLAWVPPELTTIGQNLEITCDYEKFEAEVIEKPFYDPEGTRLKL